MKKIILMCLLGLMFSQTELTTRVYDIDINIQGDSDSGDLYKYISEGYNLATSID